MFRQQNYMELQLSVTHLLTGRISIDSSFHVEVEFQYECVDFTDAVAVTCEQVN